MAAWPDYLAWTGFVCAMVESRITQVISRDGTRETNNLPLILGGLSMLSGLAILVWTFLSGPWWLAIALFFAGCIFVGITMTRNNFALFLALRWLFSLAAIACAIAIWVHGTK